MLTRVVCPRVFASHASFGGRFAMGAETEVRIEIQNASNRSISLFVKDEYPPQMILAGEREGKLRVEPHS